ncbi:ABC transporter ATP-binding protein [Candidatus Williamhamiltonella defendens]|uniref:ABC transporter ATP-binding protein n=1 Tax=Candidatus Williamhamiltonella defendens TaxID=138072 RepID=UPI001F24E0C2|nr:ABC transporter ATP-binding protein [Candidatus Hamiltonella defensa]
MKSLVVNCFKKRKLTNDVKDVHALKNINVDIRGGERIGLLGHNGAGKSTFLRTVAGLYPISSGELKVEGEVRSLFDLSLGFEQDATGRENILYRGLLLELSPSFMHEHAEKIIEFADLGEFIDYPIKTYSAGMQVRLAFSISTSVGGNILLLDEIIGAGDAKFMSKAKQRIAQLIDQADILVLASHDFHTLNSLCQRGLVFYRGEVVFDGQISDAVNNYKKINGLS